MARKNWNSWKQTDNWFVNPYNFVPLSGIERRNIEEWRGDKANRLTGRIHCTLTLKTPLALPDHAPKDQSIIKAETVKDSDIPHYLYPFMSLDGDTPFIPGSELRGMIRSVHEAATKSCLSVLDDSPLSGRSYDVKKPGILIKYEGKWTLYRGYSIPIKTFGDNKYDFSVTTENGVRKLCTRDGSLIPNLSPVGFTTERQEGSRTEYVKEIWQKEKLSGIYGYLLISELGVKDNSNHHCSHVICHKKETVKTVSQEEIDNLLSVLSFYSDEKFNLAKNGETHTGYCDYDPNRYPNGNDTLPVFYELVDDKLHLAPAMYSRERFYKTMHEIIGEHVPCSCHSTDGKGDVCPACALFGTIHEDEKNGRSYGSAVRFSDALPTSYKLAKDYVTLKELAGPKPSAAEFYLVKPEDSRTWNFEYIRRRSCFRNKKGEIKKCIDFVPYKPVLRGRKFYYHWTKVEVNDYTTDKKTNRNLSVQLLYCGDFGFDVYFDGISEQELNELIWCLYPKDPTIPEANYYHKLGMGKALGLGSISISVDSVSIRSYDAVMGDYIVNDYADYAIPDDFVAKMAEKSQKLLYMLRFDPAREWSQGYPADMKDSTKGGISYPVAKDYTAAVQSGEPDNSEASYQWFVGNRQIAKMPGERDPGTGINPKFCQTLPEADKPADPAMRLRVLKKTNDY